MKILCCRLKKAYEYTEQIIKKNIINGKKIYRSKTTAKEYILFEVISFSDESFLIVGRNDLEKKLCKYNNAKTSLTFRYSFLNKIIYFTFVVYDANIVGY